jgi:hypothetical protein
MRLRRLIIIALCAMYATLAVAQHALDNSAVVKMHAAGLSDDLIVSTINNHPGTYATESDDLIALKSAGISDKVMAAMVGRNSGVPAAAAAPAPASPFFSADVIVSYKQGDAWVPMDPERAEIKTGGILKSMATAGMKGGDVNGHLDGKASHVVLTAPVVLRATLPSGEDVSDCQIVKLHVNRDNREFHMASNSFMHVTSGPGKDAVHFDSKKLDPHTYELALPPDTAAGEYAFMAASPLKAYTFSISK